MADAPGLRERKRERTKALLWETALKLFAEQGYDRTTVDQIAQVAEISRRTFFAYFPAKEDVLFVGLHQRVDVILQGIAAHGDDETMVDVLLRAVSQVTVEPWTGSDTPPMDDARLGRLGEVELHLIRTVPALHAASLYHLTRAEDRIAGALRTAFPDDLDPVTAAALVGALVHAGTAAAVTAEACGVPPAEIRTTVRDALDLVGRGLRLALAPGTHAGPGQAAAV